MELPEPAMTSDVPLPPARTLLDQRLHAGGADHEYSLPPAYSIQFAQCLRFCLVLVIQVQQPNTHVGTRCVASADGTARACYDTSRTTATSSNSAGPASACWGPAQGDGVEQQL